MRRVLALLGAVGMIAGAIYLRALLDDDADSGGGADGRTMRIMCAEELRHACEALEDDYDVRVEDAAATADALAAGDPALDVWVVATPWPQMVDEARALDGLDPLFTGAPTAVGRTRLAIVGGIEVEGCGWRCLGDRAAEGLSIGSRPLATSGLGVLTAAAAAAGWFDTSSFASNDFEPEFDRWLSGFADAVERDGEPVHRLLQSPAFFDVAIDLEATAQAALHAASADRSAGLSLQYPAPVATIEAVVTRVGSDAPDDVAAVVAEALRDLGWRAPDDEPLGLPAPGVMTALRERVR